MLKSRNKRLKTEYTKKPTPNQTFINQVRQHHRSVQRSCSQLSNDRQSFLFKILSSINREVNYEGQSIQQIRAETDSLRRKIKEMNVQLSKIVERSIQKRTQQERISKKAIIGREMGINYNQLSKQHVLNANKIRALQEQFEQNNQKLQLLSDPSSKITIAHKVAEAETKVKQIKDQLLRIKKNKFLRQRQIIKGSDKDKAQVQDLQLQYITFAKKQEYLISRSQQINQQLADSEFNLNKLKEYYEQLKYDCSKLDEQNIPNANQEHMVLLYQSHKKKLQIHMKRNERDDQTMKRKYYNLLLEFQNSKNRVIQIQSKAVQKQQQNQKALLKINNLLQQFDNVKQQKQANRAKLQYFWRKAQSNHQIMLTQVDQDQKQRAKKKYDTSDIRNDHKRSKTKQDISSNLNESNVRDSNVRRWNHRVQGSIIRQLTDSHKQINKSKTQISQFNPNSQYQKAINSKNVSIYSGQIRHYQTQNSPKATKQNILNSLTQQDEQSYTSDFENDQSFR